MKARIKGTTEWDDFTPMFNSSGELMCFVRTSQIQRKTNECGWQVCEWPNEMMVFPEDVQEDNFTKIDWEQRRYEAAKDAMAAMLASPALLEVVTQKDEVLGSSFQDRVARKALDYACALTGMLKQLKSMEDGEEDTE